MAYFLDTSTLVKLYVREPGSEAMLRLAEQPGAIQFVTSTLAGVEFTSALFLLERSHKVSAESRSALLAQFRTDEAYRFIRQPVTDAVLSIARNLIERYPLRAYDAVQLASCVSYATTDPAPLFVCSDLQLLAAASAEGVWNWNPEANDAPGPLPPGP